MQTALQVVMMGATGAVGGEAAAALLAMPQVTRLTLLGRRAWEGGNSAKLSQQQIDIFDIKSYRAHLAGHQAALCTLGVGQPSQMSKQEFLRIDRDAALDFGRACKEAGIRHFELLGSVGANAGSASFYLRSKGELEEGLRALDFERLSLFQPSMILTPHNRYGLSQALTLAIWPHLQPVLFGPLRKLRGIRVEQLGRAMAHNLAGRQRGCEILQWDQFMALQTPPA